MSKDPAYKLKDATVVHDLEELNTALEPHGSDDVFVVGGASIYSQLLDLCDRAYITRIDYEYNADAFLPDLDKDPKWEKAFEGDEQTYFDLEYRFTEYRKKA